MYSILQLTTPR